MPSPDFTFDLSANPDLNALKPLFSHIMGANKAKPLVSLGEGVERGPAVAWLRRQHDRYNDSLGGRSAVIRSMDLPSKVELVGLVGEE